jgi:tetratricopeptide (TPR) repeat protein
VPAERIEKTVFISYRRTNFPWALAVYQDLNANGFDAFFDYKGIASGDFEQTILGNIRARAHFLVLLTPSALERCGEPGDWLRREIETALDSKRNVVPLMLEGFDFGSPSIAPHLTGKLSALSNYNGLKVIADYFFEAMDRLRSKYLNVLPSAVLHPVSSAVASASAEQKEAASAAPTVGPKELTAQEWFERGYSAVDPEEGIRCYSEAIRLDPDFAGGFNNRGVARMNKKDFDGAIQDYTEAIRLKPDLAEAFNNRGYARDEKGDLDGAIVDYTEAIRLKPDYADAFCNRGVTRKKEKDLDGAIQDYTEAILLKPDSAEAFNNRGNARSEKGDFDGAIRDYTEAIRLKPDYAEAFNNRGIARRNKKDFDGAIVDYTEAIRLRPDYAKAFYNRGIARMNEKDFDGAIQDYTEAIRLKPDYAEAFYNRGVVRGAKGDQVGATEDFEAAQRLRLKDEN